MGKVRIEFCGEKSLSEILPEFADLSEKVILEYIFTESLVFFFLLFSDFDWKLFLFLPFSVSFKTNEFPSTEKEAEENQGTKNLFSFI